MPPLLLFSTNTLLAYNISYRYYNDEHYVWCTPFFQPGSPTSPLYTVAPTSSPAEVYRTLQTEVLGGDRHSAKIASNIIGILKGAAIKKKSGKITHKQYKEIVSAVNLAQISDFRPLLYIIPYANVAKIAKSVYPGVGAHPLSQEYIIERLPGKDFDIISY